jgi:hypothetical protein
MLLMSAPKEVLIEGYTRDEILALPVADLEHLVALDRPIVFRTGSATILGQARVSDGSLAIEIAHVDGGGEGILPALWSLGPGIAHRLGLRRVEWLVHATRCARPNPALRRVLERKGFELRELPVIGAVFVLSVEVPRSPAHP